jgi:GNAT superfamily N-acetyltransferase
LNVTIRHGQPSDIPKMAELLGVLFSIESGFTPSLTIQQRGLEILLAGAPEGSLVLVAESNGDVVGMVSVQTLVSTAEGGRVGLVEDLVVNGRFRSQGIGRRLLAEAVSWARNAGLKRLQLLADQANAPAMRFYQHAGWKNRTGMICLRKLLRP